jgi:methyltransferase-like protein/ubiquinone/menaquinone biosynthesis C-methylase UbiE
MQTSYDLIPYEGFLRRQTHPDCMASRATLFGLDPAPIENCRVLELGCADGGNLLSVAYSLPNSHCIGLDLSARQIETGKQVIDDLEMKNVELHHLSITDVNDQFGKFDYIISHGVFSWIPNEVQEKTFSICRELLEPNGVAFISYNAYPGWHMREMIRDLMLYRVRDVEGPDARVKAAKEVLAGVIESVSQKQAGYGQFLRDEFQMLTQLSDYYLAHEHLEDENIPCYFEDFARRAGLHNLQYLCEADLGAMHIGRFPQSLAGIAPEEDIVKREQYLDFAQNRMFRQTLLCHADASVDRKSMVSNLAKLHVAGSAHPTSESVDLMGNTMETFRDSRGVELTCDDPLTKSALFYLAAVWPDALTLADLEKEVRSRMAAGQTIVKPQEQIDVESSRLAENLFTAASADLIQLHAGPVSYSSRVNERPRASKLARYQATNGKPVSTLQNTTATYDEMTRHLLAKLDGSKTIENLVDEMLVFVKDKNIVFQRDGQPVTNDNQLHELLRGEIQPHLIQFARDRVLERTS